MTSYFLDSSAIVKRYMAEAGTRWIEAMCASESDAVTLGEITLAEVAAVFARAVPGRRITESQRARYLATFLGHCDDEFQLLPISRAIVDRAVLISQRHQIRGYDAVQLACAVEFNEALQNDSLPALSFVSADAELIHAATAEGLAAENPNDH